MILAAQFPLSCKPYWLAFSHSLLSLRATPAHLANVARLSAFTVRGASAPRQTEGIAQ